jgi:hypothetical protein
MIARGLPQLNLRQEQALPAGRPDRLHQQRPFTHHVLPALPRRGWSTPAIASPSASAFTRAPTPQRRSTTGSAPLMRARTNSARLPSSGTIRRPPARTSAGNTTAACELRSLAAVIYTGRSRVGSTASQAAAAKPRLGQPPNPVCSRRRIRTFVDWTKTSCPARLDDPGLTLAILYRPATWADRAVRERPSRPQRGRGIAGPGQRSTCPSPVSA